MTTPRVAPGTRQDVGLLAWAVSDVAGRVAGTGPPHLFLTLGRHRRLFRGWLRFACRLMPGGVLAIEVDVRRASLVAELVSRDRRFYAIRVELDLTGRERFVLARRQEMGG